jgi:serine/threonine protein kinase
MKPSTSHRSPDAADPGRSGLEIDMDRVSSSAPALLRKECTVCGRRYPTHFLVCPTDANPLSEVSDHDGDSLIGAVLGETYEVLRVIGEGAMGRVYEARHTRLFSKRFAIKVLHGELTRQPEIVGRFLREAEATSALHHPNIVGMLDVNQVPDGRPYIVAELLEGDQLGDYFERNGKLPVAEAVAICRPICRALLAAHEKEIIHRDIKPENIFLVGEGSQRIVKVLDFGISRVGDAAGSMTRTGVVIGTPAYMPPEQARGTRVDHRADVYAVGALLYEALTGTPPFQGKDAVSTLGAVLTQEPAPARSLAPEIPAELERVVQKAMAKSPDARYASMRELDAALAEFDSSDGGLGLSSSPERQSLAPKPSAAEPVYPAGWPGKLLRACSSNAPELARTQLWALSLTAAGYLFAGSVALAIGALRLRHSGTLTGIEILLCMLGSGLVLSVPSIVWAQHLFWVVWPNTVRVVAMLVRSRRVLAASLFTYAIGMLLAHVLGALQALPVGLALSHLFVFPAALLVGGSVAWLEWKSHRADQHAS